MTTPIDARSRQEVLGDVVSLADQRLADANSDAEALSFASAQSQAGQVVTAGTFPAVDAAAPGVFSASDYAAGIPIPSSGLEELSSFGSIFSDLQNSFLALVNGDTNLMLALLVREAIKVLDDLSSVATLVKSEATKISIAAASGLLTPPSPVDVQDVRDAAQDVVDAADRSAAEMRSGVARRLAVTGPSFGSQEDFDKIFIGGAVVAASDPAIRDPPTNVSATLFSPQPSDAPGAPLEAERTYLPDDKLRLSTEELRARVIDNVKFIAICQLISNMEAGQESRKRTERSIQRLKLLFEKILKGGLVNDLLSAINELALANVDNLNQAIRDKIQSIDQFLASIKVLPLPTFVSLVNNIGDDAGNVSLTDSLLGSCGLRMEKFCDFQGLLEAAQMLDDAMGLNPSTPTRFGRVCLTIQAPERADDESPPLSTRPDGEASLILSQALNTTDTQIVGRLPRAQLRVSVKTPVPPVPGNVFGAAAVGDFDVQIIVSETAKVAGYGLVTLPVNGGLRYSSLETVSVSSPNKVLKLSLIDPVVIAEPAGGSLSVDGEHRDQFNDVYEPSDQIGGGPGKMTVAGDSETLEEIEYSSSSFDKSTGNYTFEVSSRPSPASHRLQIVGTTSASTRRVLFRESTSRNPAPRFRVVIEPSTSDLRRLEPMVSGSPADLSTEMYAGMLVVLGDDVNGTPATVSSVFPTHAILSQPYFNGAVSGVSVSSYDGVSAPGSNFVYARLAQRAIDELGLSADNSIQTLSAVMLAGQGEATRSISRKDGSFAASTSTLSTAAPIFTSADVGQIVSLTTPSSRVINAVVTGVPSANQVTLSMTDASVSAQNVLSGTAVSLSASTATGSDTKFLSELRVGDTLAVGLKLLQVTSIASDTQFSFSPPAAVPLTELSPPLRSPFGSGISFSFRRQATEKLVIGSAQRQSTPDPGSPPTSVLWKFFLAPGEPATGREHAVQDLSVTPTIRILPQNLESYPSTSTSARPRFEPDVVPPGATVIRARFDSASQGAVLWPLISSLPGTMEIGQRQVSFQSLALDPPSPLPTEDSVVVITLPSSTPLTFPVTAGTIACVITADSITDIISNLIPNPAWQAPFEEWQKLLDKQVNKLHAQICQLLQGRPQDLAMTAAAISAGALVFSLAVESLKILLQCMLFGLGDLGPVDQIIDRANESGMSNMAEAMSTGDIGAVAGMKPSTATGDGAALEKVVAYREKSETLQERGQLDNVAAELRGSERSTVLLAEMRAGFTSAVGDEIRRRQEAANALKQKALGLETV